MDDRKNLDEVAPRPPKGVRHEVPVAPGAGSRREAHDERDGEVGEDAQAGDGEEAQGEAQHLSAGMEGGVLGGVLILSLGVGTFSGACREEG